MGHCLFRYLFPHLGAGSLHPRPGGGADAHSGSSPATHFFPARGTPRAIHSFFTDRHLPSLRSPKTGQLSFHNTTIFRLQGKSPAAKSAAPGFHQLDDHGRAKRLVKTDEQVSKPWSSTGSRKCPSLVPRAGWRQALRARVNGPLLQ